VAGATEPLGIERGPLPSEELARHRWVQVGKPVGGHVHRFGERAVQLVDAGSWRGRKIT